MLSRLFKSRKGVAGASIAAALGASALIALATASAANAAIVYNNAPAPLPGNVVSNGFEATSTSEFGGQVGFAGTQKHDPKLTVTMSSWACQSGSASTGNCSTTPGAKFSHPIRFNVYRVANNGEAGRLVGAVTRTYAIPYRPSANYTHCTGDNAGKWYSIRDASCKNGRAVNITAGLGSLDLPEKAIISVEYNTTHYGYEPIGDAPCVSTTAGCPYDSLNVGVGDGDTTTPAGEPTVGTQPTPDDAYVNSTWTGAYCDGSLGTGTFRFDAGCWTGYQPLFKVRATD
jgi:hypothetical protein